MVDESSIAVRGVAHDFNNIFLNILLTVELIEQNFHSRQSCLDGLHSIKSAVLRAGDLNEYVLMQSKDREPPKQSVQLNDLVTDSINLVGSIVAKKAVLRFNLAENLPSIKANVPRLSQLFMNLVVNAAESITDKSGVICVSTGIERSANTEELGPDFEGLVREENYVFVAVSDTGRGMDSEAKGQIFHPFFRTKSGVRGLGLAQAKDVVQQHRGVITVDSEEHKGTTVRVYLPASSV